MTALLLAAGFLCGVQWRVMTYVCGNDPMVYIRSARALLHPSLYGPDAARQSLTTLAPGYSIILAVAIKLLGPLVPYWVNFGFLLALLPLMWIVFRRLMRSDRAAAFAILGLLWIAMRSHELNAPFLLYPFREASRLFFVYLAYATVLAGARDATVRRPWILASSLAVLAACAIREPSALVLPGLLLGMAGLFLPWRSRIKAWGWFLLPWSIIGVLAAYVLTQVPLTGVSQFSVVQYLRNHDVALARAREMLGWFPSRVGWLGVVMMGLGIARASIRARVLAAWFLLPGLLFFIFCAYMQMHVRYFLTALLFLAVFAGYGLDGLCAALENIRTPDRLRPHLRSLLTWACMGLLAAGLVQTARRVSVWGPRVTAAEVREWRALIAGLQPSADGRVRVVIEQRARYLEDMILSYTDAAVLDPKHVEDWPSQWAPAHYFQPMNRSARYATPQWLMWLKLYAHRIVSDQMDLLPAGPGLPPIYTIGRGEYAHHRVQPWVPGPHRQTLIMEPGRDQLLWLDWGACPSGVLRTVTIQNPTTGAFWFSQPMTGNGLQAVFLSGRTVDATQAVLTVASTNPVPSRPVFQIVDAYQPQEFDFGASRRVSVNRLLSGLDDDSLEVYPFAIWAGRWQELHAPVLHGAPDGKWNVTVIGHRKRRDFLNLRFRRHDGTEFVQEGPAPDGTCSIDMSAGETIAFVLEPHPESGRLDWLVEGLAFECRPPVPRSQ